MWQEFWQWQLLALRGEDLDPPMLNAHFRVMVETSDLAFPKLDSPYHEGQDLHDLRRAGGSTDVWILQMREEAITTTRGQGEADRREVRLLDGLILLLIDKDCKTFRKIGVWVTGLTVLVDDRHQTC